MSVEAILIAALLVAVPVTLMYWFSVNWNLPSHWLV